MADVNDLAREIDLLEQVQADLAAIATRRDEQRRQDMIVHRRALSAKIATVGQIAEPMIVALDDPGLLQTYRHKFSTMRSAAAMHQANWPAVSLGEREDEYRASATKVREANKEFVAWMRGTLTSMRRG